MCAFKQIKESCKFEQEKPTVLSLKRCTQQTQVNVKHSRLNSNHFMPCKLTMVTHMQKNYKHIKGLNIHSLKIAVFTNNSNTHALFLKPSTNHIQVQTPNHSNKSYEHMHKYCQQTKHK